MFDGRFRRGVDEAVKPVGRLLHRTRLAPDHLTALGLLLSAPTAWAIGSGRLGLGLGLLIASAVPDLLDGALAKASGLASRRGAFFDSVADRISDGLVLGATAWYMQARFGGHMFLLPLAVLGVSLLISYERAKAESLGFDAKGGIMERAERVILLCAALAFSFVMVEILWVTLAGCVLTAVQRFVKVWLQAGRADRGDAPAGIAEQERQETAVPAPQVGEVVAFPVAARWRAWREANGWAPRSARYTTGTRRSGAAHRFRERREQMRLERLRRDDPDAVWFARRRGTRRP